jgi:hypothetical protein
MPRSFRLAILALLAGAGGCSDRSSSGPTAPPDAAALRVLPVTPQRGGNPAAERAAQERLARRVALALANPDFRAYVKQSLDRSTVVEHKLHLQRWLRSADRRALRALAGASREAVTAVDADAGAAPALEFYMPVPAHRAAWQGGENILVATEREDHEVPVAFDTRGRRHLLSPDTPPATPVLAVVPVETDFDGPAPVANMYPGPGEGGGGGGGGSLPPAPPTGLYLTYAHFVQDFEGWLKGSPEFEIHVMGQAGASDSLTSYQCAGEHAASAYAFDQNGLDWSGSVLIFSQTQLNSYKSAHPGQSVRIVAIEDDDGACQIRLDGDRFKTFQNTLQNAYPNVTGGKDSVSGVVKIFRRANALQRILKAAYSFITSQDDLIGNAIEDKVVNEFHANANWIVRGENNVTNGWLKLEMR